MDVYAKATVYERSRFFEADWEEVKECFLTQWVPAQNQAAAAGLAPKVLRAVVGDELLEWHMERVDGVTLLQVVESWRDQISSDDLLIQRLVGVLKRIHQMQMDIVSATGGLHPDWAARNVMVTPQDNWMAIDWENWIVDEVDGGTDFLHETQCFASDLAMSFHEFSHKRPKIKEFLLTFNETCLVQQESSP
jgi:hypothetical protein